MRRSCRKRRRTGACAARPTAEALGSEIDGALHGPRRARATTEDVRELARTSATSGRPARPTARGDLSAASAPVRASTGRRPSRSRSTPARFTSSIRDRTRNLRGSTDERSRIVRTVLGARSSRRRSLRGATAARRRPRAARAAARATATNTSVSGSVTFDGIWTRPRATAFQDVINGFNKIYPNVNVNYKPLGNNLPTVLADGDRRRQPARYGRHRPAGHVEAVRRTREAQADHLREVDDRAELRAGLARSSGRSATSCTRSSSRRPTSRSLWYNVPAFKAAGVDAAEDVRRSS